jgi:hypothetical protein
MQPIRNIIYHPYNLLGLSAATALTAILLSPIPLLVGMVGEAAMIWLVLRLNAKDSAEVRPGEATNAQARPELSAKAFSRTREAERAPTLLNEWETTPTPTPSLKGRKSLSFAQASFISGNEEHDPTDDVIGLIDVRARSYPENEEWTTLRSQIRAVSERVGLFESWRDSLYGELVELVDAGKCRADERHDRNVANLAAPTPELALVSVQAMNVGRKLNMRTHSDSPTGPDGIDWIDAFVCAGRGYYEDELAEIAARRGHALYTSDADTLRKRSQDILATIKRIDRIARLLINLHYEMDLLKSVYGRVAAECHTHSATQISADVRAVLLHADTLARSTEPALARCA